jgi:MSHA biogenesis protein MshN
VSVINKMLQDLDRRNAVAAAGEIRPQPVKAVVAPGGGRKWFWRVLAVLVLACVSWVGWVAYQLQPSRLATPLALHAAQRAGAPSKPEPKPAPVEVVEAPKPQPVKAKPADTFKLARRMETRLAEPKPKAPTVQREAKPEPKAEPKIVLDKREAPKAANEVAETRFRRAAVLLDQARLGEAEEQLAAALQADPGHVPARQAYVALLLDQQRVASALGLLREALEADPAQSTFSLGLARIHAEQRDYAAALAVIDKAGPAAQGAEFQVLRAAVLQRLGRHEEAVAAYQQALGKSAQGGGTWTGLAISLEALGRHGEAAQAYQRALGSGALPRELRDYAEARIRALQ